MKVFQEKIKFYHRTTIESWKKIQKEGVLFGGCTYHRNNDKSGYRYTYLSPLDWGESYGKVLLEVDYEPTGIYGIDNYGFNPPPGKICDQFCVFQPISLSNVKRIK